MAGFPVIKGIATTVVEELAMSHAIKLPPANAGDGLLIMFTTPRTNSFTNLSGFTELSRINYGDYGAFATGYKIATGNEPGSATWTVANFAVQSISISLAFDKDTIESWDILPPEIETKISSIDPPLLTPSWPIRKTLWLALLSHQGINPFPVSVPPDYVETEFFYIQTMSRFNWIAERELEASSDDPGPFVLNNESVDLLAGTIAIAGKEGAPAGYTGFGAVNI